MASSSGSKLGVFPAAGGLGGSIVKHLLPLIPADNLILIARNPDKLAAESRAGAVVRKADYDDDASLDRVFDGIGALFLISYASCEHEHRSKVRLFSSLLYATKIGFSYPGGCLVRCTAKPSISPVAAGSITSSTPAWPLPARQATTPRAL
jgi:hypothetical protein